MEKSKYFANNVKVQTRRNTYQSIGVDPDHNGAMLFVAAIIALFPFVKSLAVQPLFSWLIGNPWANDHQSIVDSMSGVTTLALVYRAVWLYKRWNVIESLKREWSSKSRLDQPDKDELFRLLGAYPGRHVEIAFSDNDTESLADDLLEQFFKARWNASKMGGFFEGDHQRSGLWICGNDDEWIIGETLSGIFLPFRFEKRSVPGIRLFIGRIAN